MSDRASSLASDPRRDLIEAAARLLEERFGLTPRLGAFAPGRVEILGNHTDYNGGFILSAALDLGVAAAIAPLAEDEARIVSSAFDNESRFPVDSIERAGDWSDYVRGVVRELTRTSATIGGFALALASDVPIGSGVSSSAALEVSSAAAVSGLFDARPGDDLELARLCQRAEVEFVGMPCGILDQFSSVFGIADGFLFLDCASMDYERLRIARDDVRIVMVDTRVRHALVDGQYAERRASCERAAAIGARVLGREVRFLRDLSLADLARVGPRLDDVDRRRAEHVVNENERVVRGKRAVIEGHAEDLGELMRESHASSRDLFENSCPELDILVEEATKIGGVFGSKLSGGGFGGATVNLVEANASRRFGDEISRRYRDRCGREATVIESRIGDGARVVEFD